MQLNIQHRTSYAYSDPVNYAIQQLRLTPQTGFGQRVIRWEIRVNGAMNPYLDAFGNAAHTLVVNRRHHELEITATGEVETDLDIPPQENVLPLQAYLRTTPLTRADESLAQFARSFTGNSETRSEAMLTEMMHAILNKVAYRRGATSVQTTAVQAFAAGEGVCQDHAHIFIACCRSLGIPARYVSGYLFTKDGSLVESHAWADAWLDQGGWHSYDVSNGQRSNGIHVRLATGLDYRDACPISGVRNGGGQESMSVSVQMQQAQQ